MENRGSEVWCQGAGWAYVPHLAGERRSLNRLFPEQILLPLGGYVRKPGHKRPQHASWETPHRVFPGLRGTSAKLRVRANFFNPCPILVPSFAKVKNSLE